MNLPEEIGMGTVVYGDGLNGAAMQRARNDEYGVQCDAARKDGKSPFEESWSSDYLPNQYFSSFIALRATLALPAANLDMHPKATMLKVEPRPVGRYAGSGTCYLCRGVWAHTVVAQFGWRSTNVERASSCEACLEKVKADPAAAIAERVKWCREHPVVLPPIGPEFDPDSDIPF